MTMKYNARDRHKKHKRMYRKQAQLRGVRTPNATLHVQPSKICHILIYAGIDS